MKFWRALTRNLLWKLGSLLAAVLLWFAVVGEPELVTSQSVPILYKNLPPELLISSDLPERAHLDLRGPSGRLNSASLAEASVVLDLAGVTGPSERTFTLSISDLNLPRGVHFLRSVPSQLRLRFDRMLTREVPVQVRLSAPPPGYIVAEQRVAPERLRIAGPEARVRQIDSAQTDPIDLGSTLGAAEFRVHTYVSDPQVRLESPPVVTVRLRLERKMP